MVNTIKAKFLSRETDPKDLVLAYGKWKEASHLRGLAPTPTTVRRKLGQYFTVIDVPEGYQEVFHVRERIDVSSHGSFG